MFTRVLAIFVITCFPWLIFASNTVSVNIGGLKEAAETGQPDILFIYTDDHRADALGCAGNPSLQTPQLDRIAKNGTLFQYAYLSGADNAALCMASCAMLMTGRNFPRLKSWNLAPQPTLPSILREHGYQTFMTGKWHNGAPALSRAFPNAGPVMIGGMSDHFSTKSVEVKDGVISVPTLIKKHSTEAYTEGAINFISTVKPNSPPFFLYLAYTAPHDPRQPVSPWRERQEAALPPLPPNFLPFHPFNNGSLFVRDEHLAPWPRPEIMVRVQLAHYYAMIEHIDASIGKVIDALAKAGRLNRTIIVFAGDNGLAMGSHGLLGKQSAYEHSLRVPLIISGPGLAAGRKYKDLATINDLMPTVLDLAGINIPDGLDGRSLKPALTDSNTPVRKRLSMSLYFDNIAVHALREGPWKLIRYPYLDKTQLFNLNLDPYEMTDLSSTAEHALLIATMMKNLETEMRASGVEEQLITSRRMSSEVDWTKAKQKMDTLQPKWIRERFTYSTSDILQNK